MASQLPNTDDFLHLRSDQAIVLENVTCVYCHVALSPEISTREHVVGRKFVPVGKMDKQWNVILNACGRCNGLKADLENDISAITMQQSVCGQYAVDDPALHAAAARKGKKSISRRTKKPVSESGETITVSMPFFGGKMTANFVSGPQMEEDRVFRLCGYHLQGFFYFLTYNQEKRIGFCWPGSITPLFHTIRSDWGNPLVQAFTNLVSSWEPRLIGETGDGFFKVSIRKHPSETIWSWALEWNQKHRIVGFFGNHKAAQGFVDTFPDEARSRLRDPTQNGFLIRIDTPLAESDDYLFDGIDETESAAAGTCNRR